MEKYKNYALKPDGDQKQTVYSITLPDLRTMITGMGIEAAIIGV